MKIEKTTEEHQQATQRVQFYVVDPLASFMLLCAPIGQCHGQIVEVVP